MLTGIKRRSEAWAAETAGHGTGPGDAATNSASATG
jgi:hypothetical protein